MQEEGANARICQLVVRSLSKPPNYLNEAPAGLGGGKLRLTTSDRARFVVSHSWSTNSSYAGEGGPTHIVSSARRSIGLSKRMHACLCFPLGVLIETLRRGFGRQRTPGNWRCAGKRRTRGRVRDGHAVKLTVTGAGLTLEGRGERFRFVFVGISGAPDIRIKNAISGR